MSGDRRARRKEKRAKQQRDFRLRPRSKSVIENKAYPSGTAGLTHLEPNTVLLLSFTIDYDPVEVPRSPQIQEWAEEGFEALQRSNGKKAETLFKKCLEADGDAPDLMNNLAAAYEMQGRHQESLELARAVHARWPEYFFGRIFMANRAAHEGRLDDAEQYLQPMLTQPRFHISEFRALATAYIQLEIARNRLAAAQSWVDLFKSVDPDHQSLNSFQQRINTRSIRRRLLDLITTRWR